jgi:hypothetical protein
MTDQLEGPVDPDDPVAAANYVVRDAVKPVWYKRAWVLATAAVAAVVVASVIVDLPSHTTTASDTAAQTSVLQQINQGLAGCAYAAQETFMIYQDMKMGTLTSADRNLTPSLLRDDQTACSFTSSTIYDLSNVEGTGSPAGKRVGDVVDVATLWATSDALAAIEDIQTIYDKRGSASTTANLSHQEVALAHDRALALADVRAADTILHTHLPMPDLPALPHLVGTS